MNNNMPAWIKKILCAGILLSSFMLSAVRADTVVQFTINGYINGLYGTVNNYQVQLLDSQAPITVANFLTYVNNHNYDNTIIHRSMPDFIIQGGGFTNQLTSVVSYGPIQNEFSTTRSNVRGTIAMAKLPGDVNSATNQWFINAADNHLNLDNQNGGFTVFGKVIGEGMSVVDAIGSIQTYNLGGNFTNIPLINYTPPNLYSSNLIGFTSVAVVPTIAWKGGSSSGATKWDLAANWAPGTTAPNGAGVNLVVGSQNSAYNVIDMTSNGRTVGNIYFNSNVGTTIKSTGNYSLTIDNGTSASAINVLGNQTISAPLILNSNAIFSGDGTLTLSGGVSSAHGMAVMGSNIIARSINVNTLTLDSGSTLTIQPLPGGPFGEAIAPVAEPSTMILLGIGFCGLLAYGRRRRKRAA
jgi:cyclophilin family peptidyl-prolyl cis-trans isomerase